MPDEAHVGPEQSKASDNAEKVWRDPLTVGTHEAQPTRTELAFGLATQKPVTLRSEAGESESLWGS